MPTTYYSEEEYRTLQRQCTKLQEQVTVLKEIQPTWALGDAYHATAALAAVWKHLGVTHQTACMTELRRLTGN